MRFLLFLFLTVCPSAAQYVAFGFNIGPVSSGPSVINHTSSAGQSTTTTSGINTTGATLIWVGLVYQVGSTCTISSSPSNTFSSGSLYGSSGAIGSKAFWVFSPSTGSSQTFTMTGTNCYGAFNVVAVSGTFGGTAEGQNGATASSPATSIQPGTTSSLTGAPNEICLSEVGISNTYSALGINSSFASPLDAQPYNGSGNIHEGGAASYLVPSSSTALDPTWSWTGSTGNSVATIVCFK